MKKFFILYIIIMISCITNLICMEPMNSAGRQAIIYAPWRENYINAQNQHHKSDLYKPCTFCTIINNKNNLENLILHRGKHSLIMLASQPYINNGIHFLIVPYEHKKELSDLSAETYNEENMFTQKLCALFSSHANQTYINSNQGSAAGASIPEHHHKHIMINYAPTFYNLITAIQETKKNIDLQSLYKQLQPHINQLETIMLPQKQLRNFHTDCYYCLVMQQHKCQENLIIHRGKHATIMLSHYPTYFGEIDIVPNKHIESLETMPSEIYEEINQATIEIYPLMLKIMNAQDSNIGLVSYGDKAMHKEHIRQKLIPRKDSWKKTPITKSNHINGDINKFYRKLLSEWYMLHHKAKL
jgi:ATP adenylyltransferase